METLQQIPIHPKPNNSNRMLLKGMLILGMILLLFIPMFYVQSLVKERAARKSEVLKEVSSKWSAAQTIKGPILMIPYRYYEKQTETRTVEHKGFAYFLPDELQIAGKIDTVKKKRSIYEVPLYRSRLTLKGTFPVPDFSRFNVPAENILWNEAMLMVGIDDVRGLEDSIGLIWNGSTTQLQTASPDNDIVKTGFTTRVTISRDAATSFSVDVSMKGSQHLYFTPVGKITSVHIQSAWRHPSFEGNFLPVSSDVSVHGFKANWKVAQASRNYPQSWINGSVDLAQSAFGVRLVDPTDYYAKNERSVKYALLFIGLTFLVFFLIEALQKINIHPFQYALVGISLVVFYTLLLSFSEYTGFNIAYIIAMSATVLLIGGYVWSVFRNGKIAFFFTAGLTGLYAYIFFLIQLEDYSLLFGSVALFLVVAAVMLATRKIDWYALGKPSSGAV